MYRGRSLETFRESDFYLSVPFEVRGSNLLGTFQIYTVLPKKHHPLQAMDPLSLPGHYLPACMEYSSFYSQNLLGVIEKTASVDYF